MAFSKIEMQQLDDSLTSLKQASSLKKIILDIAQNDAWFFQRIIKILNNGITFHSKQMEQAGYFHLCDKQLVLNEQFLNNYEKITYGKDYLKLLLRHELTHAFDMSALNASYLKGEWDDMMASLWNSLDFANQLHNQLNCIDYTATVNPEVLSKLASMNLILDNKPHYGNLIFGYHSGNEQPIKSFGSEQIAFFGNEPSSNGSFTFSVFPIPNDLTTDSDILSLMHESRDYSKASDALNNTASQRLSVLDISRANQLKVMLAQSRLLPMWQSLNQEQREVLDFLYRLRSEISIYTRQDEDCSRILAACAKEPVLNCFNEFYSCQLENSFIPVKAQIMLLEINALLFERGYGQKFNADDLSSLCLKTILPVCDKRTSPQRLHPGQLELICFEPVQPSYVYEAASYMTQGFGYGFLNSISAAIVDSKQRVNPELLKAGIRQLIVWNMGLLSYILSDESSSSFAFQVLLPSTVSLVSYGIEALTARYTSPRTSQIATAISHTFFASSQVINGGVEKMVPNILSNVAGQWVGKKIGDLAAGFFGWSKPEPTDSISTHTIVLNV